METWDERKTGKEGLGSMLGGELRDNKDEGERMAGEQQETYGSWGL